MVERAIIEEIDDYYHYKVRIPRVHGAEFSSTGASTEYLSVATVSVPPGIKPQLVVGDVVIIGYNEVEIQEPVILGLLYRDSTDKAYIDIIASSLSVNVACTLPSDTKIGDVSSNDIKNISNSKGNIQGQLDILEARIKALEGGS